MLVNNQTIRISKQRGFTLMEVMIASFVLAVGMLGSTALMLRGMQQADNTNYEAVAVELSMNMAERMRGNLQGVLDGDYDSLDSVTTGGDCSASFCTGSAVSDYHALVWGTELDDLMPNANATGTVRQLTPGSAPDATPIVDPTFTITVTWTRGVRTGTDTYDNSADNNSYVMIFQP